MEKHLILVIFRKLNRKLINNLKILKIIEIVTMLKIYIIKVNKIALQTNQ